MSDLARTDLDTLVELRLCLASYAARVSDIERYVTSRARKAARRSSGPVAASTAAANIVRQG